MNVSDDDLDRRLHQWAAAERNAAATVTVPLLTGRSPTTFRRRARLIAMAGAAAVVTATAIGLTVLRGQPTSNPTRPATGPTTTTSVPAGMRLWDFHGLTVQAPRSWPENALRCGTPTRSTVITYEGPIETCAYVRPGNVSFIKFETYNPGQHIYTPASSLPPTPILLDGVTAQKRVGVTNAGPSHGLHIIEMRIPSRGLIVSVNTPSETETARLANTLHLMTR